MSAQDLFGPDEERDAFEALVADRPTTEDNLPPYIPTLTITLFVCPVLTYQYEC